MSDNMSNEVMLEILDIKSLTNYVVRKVSAPEGKAFQMLEEMLQKIDNTCEDYTPLGGREEIVVDSLVCVFSTADNTRNARKQWLRAIVRNVFVSVGSYLYEVFLLDYGLVRLVKRPEVRQMRPHFTDGFVSYQALNFIIFGVEEEVNVSEESMKWIKDLLKRNDFKVLANLRPNKSKSYVLGSIRLQDSSDLASLLVAKCLATDIGLNKASNQFIPETTVRKPNSSPSYRVSEDSDEEKSFINTKPINHLNNSFDINSCSANASISSISSADISIASDNASNGSIILDNNDSQESEDMQITGYKVKERVLPKNSNVMNGMNGQKMEKMSERFLRLKLNQEISDSALNGQDLHEINDKNENDLPIQESNEEPVDWPVVKTNRRSFGALNPAGVLPPLPGVGRGHRVYTLRPEY